MTLRAWALVLLAGALLATWINLNLRDPELSGAALLGALVAVAILARPYPRKGNR